MSLLSTFKHIFTDEFPFAEQELGEEIVSSKVAAPPRRPVTNSAPVANYNSGRSSVPEVLQSGLSAMGDYNIVNTPFTRGAIKIIRKLAMVNEDVSQAVHNIVTLGNTGHKVIFDKSVPVEQQLKMKNHLFNKRKDWASGTANMDGLVNKFISQVLIGGALSTEWVIKNDLSGVENCILVNPEDIYFKLNKNRTKYEPYQRVQNGLLSKVDMDGLVKLNTNTYKYFALNGDTELPNGIPPYLPVLQKILTKRNMDTNIDFIVDQMGLIGFLQALITPSEELGDENEIGYTTRLEAELNTVKARLAKGMKDGIVVGIKDEAEFQFHSIGKEIGSAISDLYKSNEQQIASALKQDPSLWGRDYNTSEASINVVFMKMISELKNMQNLVKSNLEFGYSLELRLAGFQFDFLEVRFNRTTISDDLKFHQAEEIKVRNTTQKMILGIINQDEAADELGYDTPAEKQPMVSWEILAGGSDPVAAAKAQDIKKDIKNKSAKKGRDKNKPVPKNK